MTRTAFKNTFQFDEAYPDDLEIFTLRFYHEKASQYFFVK